MKNGPIIWLPTIPIHTLFFWGCWEWNYCAHLVPLDTILAKKLWLVVITSKTVSQNYTHGSSNACWREETWGLSSMANNTLNFLVDTWFRASCSQKIFNMTTCFIFMKYLHIAGLLMSRPKYSTLNKIRTSS